MKVIHAQTRAFGRFIMYTVCGHQLVSSSIITADYHEEVTCKRCLKLLKG